MKADPLAGTLIEPIRGTANDAIKAGTAADTAAGRAGNEPI